MMPMVVKRDGTKEKFSVINVSRVAQASGLTPTQAKEIAEKLSLWAQYLNIESITSLEIRDRFILEIEAMNPNAADLYKWYEQSKDTK